MLYKIGKTSFPARTTQNQGQDNNESVKIMAVINVVSNYHYQTRIYDRITHTSCFSHCTRKANTLRSDVTRLFEQTRDKRLKTFLLDQLRLLQHSSKQDHYIFPFPVKLRAELIPSIFITIPKKLLYNFGPRWTAKDEVCALNEIQGDKIFLFSTASDKWWLNWN